MSRPTNSCTLRACLGPNEAPNPVTWNCRLSGRGSYTLSSTAYGDVSANGGANRARDARGGGANAERHEAQHREAEALTRLWPGPVAFHFGHC
jgi:hypothetical protein